MPTEADIDMGNIQIEVEDVFAQVDFRATESDITMMEQNMTERTRTRCGRCSRPRPVKNQNHCPKQFNMPMDGIRIDHGDHGEEVDLLASHQGEGYGQGLSQHIFGSCYRTLSENWLDTLEKLENKILRDWKGEKWLTTRAIFSGGIFLSI